MTRKITKKQEAKLISDVGKIRDLYSNPDFLDKELNLLIEYANLSEKKLTKEENERRDELEIEICLMYGLENGVWVSNIGYRKDCPMLARIRQKIVKDYDCNTALELILADTITACYWRITKNETRLTRLMEDKDGSGSFDQLKVNVIKELNKAVDSASRRMNMSISLLKEIKQPPMKVNVKTKNAFIGQNQQFNNNQNQKDENNESK